MLRSSISFFAQPAWPTATARSASNVHAANGTATIKKEPMLRLNCPAPQGGVAFTHTTARSLAIGGEDLVHMTPTAGARLRRFKRVGAACAASICK